MKNSIFAILCCFAFALPNNPLQSKASDLAGSLISLNDEVGKKIGSKESISAISSIGTHSFEKKVKPILIAGQSAVHSAKTFGFSTGIASRKRPANLDTFASAGSIGPPELPVQVKQMDDYEKMLIRNAALKGKTIKEIAEMTGMKYGAIWRFLKRKEIPNQAAQRRKKTMLKESEKLMIREAALSGKSLKEIAELTGRDISIIWRLLQREGITASSPVKKRSEEVEQKILEIVVNGMTLKEIGDSVGRNPETIRRFLKKKGYNVINNKIFIPTENSSTEAVALGTQNLAKEIALMMKKHGIIMPK